MENHFKSGIFKLYNFQMDTNVGHFSNIDWNTWNQEHFYIFNPFCVAKLKLCLMCWNQFKQISFFKEKTQFLKMINFWLERNNFCFLYVPVWQWRCCSKSWGKCYKYIIKKITSCMLAYCQAIINIQMMRNILSYLESGCIEISSDKKVRVTISKNKN